MCLKVNRTCWFPRRCHCHYSPRRRRHVSRRFSLRQENDEKMMRKWWENDEKMMRKWCENDEKMMRKWCEQDTKMMRKWRENDEKMKRSYFSLRRRREVSALRRPRRRFRMLLVQVIIVNAKFIIIISSLSCHHVIMSSLSCHHYHS